MTLRKPSEFENSRPFDVHKWSDYPEVNTVINIIYKEILSLNVIHMNRQRNADHRTKVRKYIKVLALDLYVNHLSDPSRYLSYPRNHNKLKNNRYNCIFIKTELLAKVVDWFQSLGYVENKLGHYFPSSKKQSRVRATDKLIYLIRDKGLVSPLMIKTYEDAETIILRDEKKNTVDYIDTTETDLMRSNLKIINGVLDQTLINIYLPDTELIKLIQRMVTGKSESDIEHEEPRGALDFNRRQVYRVFNNGSFEQGGRFYGGWWQGIPRAYRKFIKINHMLTIESDYSGMHINLLYAKIGLPMPFDDPYSLENMPTGTREVVKRSLLTIINAKDRKSALQSIRKQIREKKFTLPKGINKIEEIIAPFEDKHKPISEYFFSGQGVYLQKLDSQIAEHIMLTLAKKGIPALPLHDSFIVSHHHEKALKIIMHEAFNLVTNHTAKLDNKTSLIDINRQRPLAELQAEQDSRSNTLNSSDEFKDKIYATYYRINREWKAVTGRDNIFPYNPNQTFNKETY